VFPPSPGGRELEGGGLSQVSLTLALSLQGRGKLLLDCFITPLLAMTKTGMPRASALGTIGADAPIYPIIPRM